MKGMDEENVGACLLAISVGGILLGLKYDVSAGLTFAFISFVFLVCIDGICRAIREK
jgi:hypothetical protein